MTARVAVLARYVAAAILGAASVLGFAPYRLAVIPLLALALLFLLWRGCASVRAAAVLGLIFGLGFFLTGTSWIYVSLHTFGGMPAVLTAIATFIFSAVVACYPALALGLAKRIARDDVSAPREARAMLIVLPACWTLGELLRGTLWTGFPWLGLGYSQVPGSPLAGYAALLGSYGVTLLCAVCAGALGLLMIRITHRAPLQLALPLAVIAIAIGAGAALRGVAWTQAEGKPVSVALLQGNVAQERKFNPEVLPLIFAEYRQMVEKSGAQLIILPETAFPVFVHQIEPEYLDAIAKHAVANQGDVVFGVAIADPQARAYFNSIVSTGTSEPQAYRKRHLVPFGEYLPWRPVFAWVLDVLDIPMADFTPGPLDPPPMAAAGERLALSICYEDAFGSLMRRQLPEATLLVNISNDAWFGDSLAAEQHWQIAQMRALESGRMMLRANNTGVTGIIGIDGNEVSRVPGFTTATLTGEAQGRSGATPYVRIGEWGTVTIVAGALISALVLMRRRSTNRIAGSSPTSTKDQS